MEQLGFDFGIEPKRLARVTPARLGAFDDCPRRYRFAYLDRPAPRRTGAFAHNTMGAAVHAALKAVHELPVRRRTPERAAALVTRHWQDAGFADAAQSALYAERARGWVAEYVRRRLPTGHDAPDHTDHAGHDHTDHAGHEATDAGDDPVGRGDGDAGEGTVVGLERWVSAPVGPGGGSPTLIVEGRIDRIDERDGELVVVDYKTGRRVPDEATARGSRALALYAVAVAHTLRTPCRRVELHHLPGQTVAAAEHTRESLDEHLRRAEETAGATATATDTLQAGGDADAAFPARPAPRCGWCEFRLSCPEGREAAPAARPWDLLTPAT
ncbi:RecB family exonuclease [Saccharomonospora iraqiensis]|uniref:RecB family exonuclease n=1 Tax=Saccharomonospora iraqiensis TaxID=52698 RepID=UPI0004039E0F|nr:PD-(D/E)XK nuclease family protein [Saccharomonospora iraqiensis]